MNVTLQSAKMIGAGLATIGLTGVGVGVRNRIWFFSNGITLVIHL